MRRGRRWPARLTAPRRRAPCPVRPEGRHPAHVHHRRQGCPGYSGSSRTARAPSGSRALNAMPALAAPGNSSASRLFAFSAASIPVVPPSRMSRARSSSYFARSFSRSILSEASSCDWPYLIVAHLLVRRVPLAQLGQRLDRRGRPERGQPLVEVALHAVVQHARLSGQQQVVLRVVGDHAGDVDVDDGSRPAPSGPRSRRPWPPSARG